jgi:hypothetical protein
MEIIGVFSSNSTNHINTQCGPSTEGMNINLSGKYTYRQAP